MSGTDNTLDKHMKALVLTQVGKLEYKEIPKPEPKEGEVLVKVMACGICGSDIPRAYRDGAHNMPVIIGHEFSGFVESAAEGSDSKWIGKRVGIFPLIPCGKCVPCRRRQFEMCRNYDYLGSRRNGGFAEYVSVPAKNLIKLPDNVSYEAAAMLEPMAVAVHAIRNVTRFVSEDEKKDKTVAVIGLGTIGTILVSFLLEAGFEKLLVIGNKEFQKNTMEKMEIPSDCYCDSRSESAHDFVMDRTDGHGADIFFECVGSNETAVVATDSAAPAGSVCFVGNPHSDMTFEKSVYWKILRNQLHICGTWNSYFSIDGHDEDDDWNYVQKRLADKKIDPEKLITQRFGIEDIISGFELMRDKTEDYIKVMAVMKD